MARPPLPQYYGNLEVLYDFSDDINNWSDQSNSTLKSVELSDLHNDYGDKSLLMKVQDAASNKASKWLTNSVDFNLNGSHYLAIKVGFDIDVDNVSPDGLQQNVDIKILMGNVAGVWQDYLSGRTQFRLLNGDKQETMICIVDLREGRGEVDYFAGGGTGFDLTQNIKRMQIELRTQNTTNLVAHAYFDGLFSYRAKTKVCLTLDDCFESQYSVLYQEMKKYGLVATCYLVGTETPDGAADGVLGPESKLKSGKTKRDELQAAGWQMASHSYVHTAMTSLSEADQLSGIVLNEAWMRDFGGADYTSPNVNKHFCNVGGAQTEYSKTKLAELGYKTARTVATGGGKNGDLQASNHPLSLQGNSLNLRTDNLGANTVSTAQVALDNLDDCINRGNSYFMYGHQFLANPAADPIPGQCFSTAETILLVKGLADRVAAGLCDVVTVDEFSSGVTQPRSIV